MPQLSSLSGKSSSRFHRDGRPRSAKSRAKRKEKKARRRAERAAAAAGAGVDLGLDGFDDDDSPDGSEVTEALTDAEVRAVPPRAADERRTRLTC